MWVCLANFLLLSHHQTFPRQSRHHHLQQIKSSRATTSNHFMESKPQSDYIQQCCHPYYVIQELAINVQYCKQHVLINGKADWSLLTSSSSPPLSLSVSFGQPVILQETSTNKSKQTIITITSSLLLLLLPFCQDNWGNSSISRTEATTLFISKTKLYSPHHLVVVTASSSRER